MAEDRKPEMGGKMPFLPHSVSLSGPHTVSAAAPISSLLCFKLSEVSGQMVGYEMTVVTSLLSGRNGVQFY